MRVLLVATVQSHICQFHKPLAKVIHEHGAEIHVAARNNLAEKNGLALDFVEKIYDLPFSRSPKSIDNIKAYKQLRRIIIDGNYDIVHCNTPMGGIVARLAALKARKKGTKVIYTAHGFHFYKGASKKNWLFFYPIEKFFADHFTDKLVTITGEDYELARNKFKTSVYRMHGVGANSTKYFPVSVEEKERLREENGYSKVAPILLCVGELNKNKNQATAIKAMKKVIEVFPDCKLLIAGNGPMEEDLRNLISVLCLNESVELLGYTLELDKYLQMSDVAVSLSFREGLPFNIMEAMLSKKTIVASNNRGHRELIDNGVNGKLVSATDVDGFAEQVIEILSNKDEAEKLAENAKIKVNLYTDSSVEKEIEDIYFNN